jgi:hypothetical protein
VCHTSVVFRKLLSYLRGSVRTQLQSAPDEDDEPRYGVSVSYKPCPVCEEGTMGYDDDAGESRCTVCGEPGD